MSTQTSADPRRIRNTVFITLGTIIIVATYLYLALGQQAEFAEDNLSVENNLSSAGLVVIGGYLVGAVLLAIGAIHRLSTTTITIIPIAIALNIAVGQIVAQLGLTIYLDAIGTVLVGAIAGPAAGVITGILTNVIWGLTLSPIALPYAVVQVVIGVMAGYAARTGMFRRYYLAPIAGGVTGIVSAFLSSPISAFVFGGAVGGGTAALVGAFQAAGSGLLEATTLQGLISDPLDKAITFVIVVVILAALPSRFLQRFPFVRQFRVFGKVGAKATRRTSA